MERLCSTCQHASLTYAACVELGCHPKTHTKWIQMANVPSPDDAGPAVQRAAPLAGRKNDDGKVRLDLLPTEALEEIAKVLTFGAKKYAAHNWRRGFVWSRTVAAMLRHLYAWMRGEDKDPESGLSHMAHVGCNVLFLLTFIVTKTGEDDRFKEDA